MNQIRILLTIGAMLIAGSSPSVSYSIPEEAAPGTILDQGIEAIKRGAPSLRQAVIAARSLMWSIGVNKEDTHEEIQDIIGKYRHLVETNADLTRRVAAVAAAPVGLDALRDELRDARAEGVRLTVTIRDLTRERDDLRTARDEIQRRLEAMTAERDVLRGENVRLVAQLADLRRERDRINADLDRVTRERDALKAERDAAQRAREQAETQNRLLNTQITALARERDDLTQRIADMQRERLLVDQDLATAQRDLRDTKAERDRLATAQKELARKFNELEAQRAALELGLTQAKADKTAADQAAETQRVRYIRLDQENKALEKTHQEKLARLAELEAEKLKFVEERRQHADQVKALQEEIARQRAAVQSLTAQVDELNGILEGIKEGQPRLIKAFDNSAEFLSSAEIASLLAPFGGDLKKLMQAATLPASHQYTEAKGKLADLRKHLGILPETNMNEVLNTLGEMAQIQSAVAPKKRKNVKDLRIDLTALRADPAINAGEEESLLEAVKRLREERESAEKVKRAMMGAGFLAVENPYGTLKIIGQAISADGTYGRTGGEKQIPVNSIAEIVRAVNILARKETTQVKALLSAIAEGMGISVENLPRTVNALMPMALMAELLKGDKGTTAEERRNIFAELSGIKAARPKIKITGLASPKGETPSSPIIGSEKDPDAVDILFGLNEWVRRQAEATRASGKATAPDVFAAALKAKCGLTRHPSFHSADSATTRVRTP